jgi:hypothetical protein
MYVLAVNARTVAAARNQSFEALAVFFEAHALPTFATALMGMLLCLKMALRDRMYKIIGVRLSHEVILPVE